MVVSKVTARSSARSTPATSPAWRDTPAADRIARLREELSRRVLVLDGAMGTMVQSYQLTEEDFRGDRFKDHPSSLMGAGDLLALTRPHVLDEIHRAYLRAGADLIETNTFVATRIALADYDLQQHAREINREAARIARRAVDDVAEATGRPRWVGDFDRVAVGFERAHREGVAQIVQPRALLAGQAAQTDLAGDAQEQRVKRCVGRAPAVIA